MRWAPGAWLSGLGCSRPDAVPHGPPGGTGRVVSVTVHPVQKRDVPVYLQGLGVASGYYTVVVRPQVEGRLDKVLFNEGQKVRAGDLLARIDVRPFEIALRQARATLVRDTASLKNARLNLQRNRALRDNNLVPEQMVTDLQAQADSLEGTVMADEAAVQTSELQLSWAHITSPIDGVTGVRLVDPGNVVHASDPNGLVVITQLDPMVVLFTLPEDNLPDVAQAMAAGPVQVTATSRDAKTTLGQGVVKLIDNLINTQSGTIRLKSVFPNPKGLLWPNQFVKTRLLLRTYQGALVVPAAAVQHGPKGDFVYTVDANSRVVHRPIELDGIQEDWALMRSGLTEGEQVLQDGQSQVQPGSQVATHPASL